MGMTPEVSGSSVGACLNSECDGQFYFDDGVTTYDYATSGIYLKHSDQESGCINAYYNATSEEPKLDDVHCTVHRYVLCRCPHKEP